MSTILERLREALTPDLQVEREIACGGMGIVYAGRDKTLDRPVAIKILRPEQATARAAEKFLREARILANLRHPNVIPVHRAGATDGFFYYVMDLVTGGTLAERLEDGPLPPEDALKLGRDLLDALETVHDLGVVHRDIKPSNVFLVGNRAVLTDFGIARPSRDPADTTTTDARVAGTIGYMPPEQAYGRDVTNRTDLYAVAMLVFEAYTGRRWSDTPPDAKPNWSGVPAKVVPVLRQALAWEPERRWPDAATFRRALWQTRTLRYKRYKWYATAVAATTLALGTLVGKYVYRTAPIAFDLAVLPFVADHGVDVAVAEKLTTLTRYHLDDLFDLAPSNLEDRVLARDISVNSVGAAALQAIGVKSAAYGRVTLEGNDFAVNVRVINQRGEWIDAGTVSLDTSDLGRAGYELGLYVARQVDPNRAREYTGSTVLAEHSSAAISAFVEGELAFARNEWAVAVEHYGTALDSDSTFVLAAVRFWNAHRWLLTGKPGIDLKRIFEEHGHELSTRDRLIVGATLAADAATRYEIYKSAIQEFPRHVDVAHAYAEELFNRGPLTGIPLDTAAYWLAAAVEKDSSFSPAVLSLLWASIRLGRRDAAQRWLVLYEKLTSSTQEGSKLLPLIQYAFLQRFQPEQHSEQLPEFLASPDARAAVASWFRLGPTFGIPKTQVDIGKALATDPSYAASAHEGQALGQVALGRIAAALTHFDSAAGLFGTPTARLEAAEWRVVAPTLGLPGVPLAETQRGLRILESQTSDPELRTRSAWALALHASLVGDAAAARLWRDMLDRSLPDTAAERLGVLLDAVFDGAAGQLTAAVQRSEVALAWDSGGKGGDPFATTVLHVLRGQWLEDLGRQDEADAAWLWYEHNNMDVVLTGEARAAEVDWAFGSYAMWLRGAAGAARGNSQRACQFLPRVVELWRDADSAYSPLRDSASTLIANLDCLP